MQPTVYKLSVDGVGQATLASGEVSTVHMVRREGAARLLVWRHAESGQPLRIAREGKRGRLVLPSVEPRE